jgi:hypothetical protein
LRNDNEAPLREDDGSNEIVPDDSKHLIAGE